MKTAQLLLLCSLLLTACGEENVHSACYANGDHANMSDGKITRICDCIAKAVALQQPTARETGWIITLLKGRRIVDDTPADQAAIKQIQGFIQQKQASCRLKS